MLPIKQVLPADQRELLKLYTKLGELDRHSLIRFAGFLAEQQQEEAGEVTEEAVDTEPLRIPRPASETVIKAIRRLSKTYPMLDKKHLVDGTSSLMSAHVLQGKAAPQVIDELELLFEQHYTNYISDDDE